MCNNHFLSDPNPIIVYPCFSLSHSCLVNLTDVTLAVEDQTNLASNASFFRGGLFRAEGKELYMMFFNYPAPLFSSEMKKCQQANWSWEREPLVGSLAFSHFGTELGGSVKKIALYETPRRLHWLHIFSWDNPDHIMAGSSFFIFPISKNSVPPVHSWGWFKVNSVGGTVFGGA